MDSQETLCFCIIILFGGVCAGAWSTAALAWWVRECQREAAHREAIENYRESDEEKTI